MNHNKKLVKLSACFLTGAIALTSPSFTVGAASISDLPSAGIEAALNDCYTVSADVSIKEYLAPKVQTPAETSDKAVAKVKEYVNIRKGASEDTKSLGKLYKGCVGTVVGSKDGWTKIKSGSVIGYVKNDYLYLGEEAEKQAAKVGKKIATVNTTTLKVRKKASEKAEVLDLAPIGEEMNVTKQTDDGWVGVKFNGEKGYVSEEYVEIKTVYNEAESKEEEEARLAAEEAERQAELEREQAEQNSSTSSGSSSSSSRSSSSSSSSSSRSSSSKSSGRTYKSPGSASGQAVVSYASQFVGNPYKWGGTSLTNGCDCSGFVLAVYSKFGVGLPHSSSAMRGVGRGVSYSEVQPGDIICYSGHVGIYAGGGRIVNALNSRAGITYTSATYKSILAVRRIF